jgi:hypothetical protein
MDPESGASLGEPLECQTDLVGEEPFDYENLRSKPTRKAKVVA